jgi:outer membrane protein assembly factor BamB
VIRVTTDGVLAPVSLEVEGNVWTWLGTPPAGPVYASTNGTDRPRFLYRTRAGGGSDRVQLEEVSSFVWDGECLLAAGAAYCWNVAYDLGDGGDLSLLFHRDPPRLIDGGLRGISQPAFDGRLLWSLVYGISTYEVVAIDPRTGEEVIRHPLARTTRGQTDMVASPVVIGPSGEVLVYFSGHRTDGPDGQLHALSPEDGSELWSYPAPRSPRPRGGVFSTTSSLAVGDANVVYLAVGEGVHAVVVSNGVGRWVASSVGDMNEPELQISPLGDIAALNAGGQLYIIVTESLTVARSPWPVAGGGPSASYAR